MIRTPLTVGQVSRRCCVRCKKRPGYSTWGICADGNRQRVLCVECDILLNDLALRFVRDRSRKAKMIRYVRKVQA